MLYQNGEVLGNPSPMSKRSERIERNVEGWIPKKFWWSMDNVRQTFNHYQPFPADAERMPKGMNFSWWHSASLRIPPQANQQRKVEPTAWVAEEANPIVECESGKSMKIIKSGWNFLKQGFSPIAVNISISFSNIHSTGNPLILQHSHKLKIEKGSEKLSKQYCNLVKSIQARFLSFVQLKPSFKKF